MKWQRPDPSSHLPAALWLSGFLCLAGSLLLGCSEDSSKPFPENIPPVTYLSIRGSDLDTLDYRQILYWWGSDRDGQVVGYCVHWDGGWTPPPDAQRCAFDTTWIFTTATTDTFDVPVGSNFPTDTSRVAVASRTFSVRAVDNDGAADPIGRTQVFNVESWAPTLEWGTEFPLPARSLPAISFAWHPLDHDGRETVTLFRYWLDGTDSTRALTASDTVTAIRPEDFLENGVPRYGARTLSVQGYDDAQTPSNIIRHTWTVEPPTGDYLLIDNVASYVPGGPVREDPFYRAMLDSVARGNYSSIDFEQSGGFRTSLEVFPLFSMFQGVVWYGGLKDTRNDLSVFRNLVMAEKGIREYLAAGGRIMLVANNAVGDTAGLTVAFAKDVLGVPAFYRIKKLHNLSVERNSILFTDIAGVTDSLMATSTTLGADFMQLDPDVQGLWWAPPGFLAAGHPGQEVVPDQSTERAYLGVLSTRGGGRIGVITFLLSRTNDQSNHLAAAVFRRVLLE